MNTSSIFEPKISSKIWQGTPPKHWPIKRLKWSITGIHNGIWGNDPDGDCDIICVRVADFNRTQRLVVNKPPTIRSIDPRYRDKRLLKKGDLLIEKSGGGENQLVGCTVLFNHEFEAVCSNFVARAPLQNGMIPEYWNYLHLSLYSSRLNYSAIKQNTGIQNLDAEIYLNIEVAFPPTEEQSIIADHLNRKTSHIDRLISLKEKMLLLLEEKRIANISHTITKGLDSKAPLKSSGYSWLGEVPAHWEVWRLKYLADVRGGLTIGTQYSNSDLSTYHYLRVANVQDGFLALNNVSTVEVPASEAKANLLAYGDVLMNEGGDIDKLGRGCIWRDEIKPCLHQNHVFAVRPHSVDSEWLALWTSTLEAKRYFEMRAKRSTNLASISGSNIKELAVPIPPIAEQQAIKRHLEAASVRTEAIRKKLAESISLLRERRAALITDAVTGKIPLEEMTA